MSLIIASPFMVGALFIAWRQIRYTNWSPRAVRRRLLKMEREDEAAVAAVRYARGRL